MIVIVVVVSSDVGHDQTTNESDPDSGSGLAAVDRIAVIALIIVAITTVIATIVVAAVVAAVVVIAIVVVVRG
jgi:hypothetical protein